MKFIPYFMQPSTFKDNLDRALWIQRMPCLFFEALTNHIRYLPSRGGSFCDLENDLSCIVT